MIKTIELLFIAGVLINLLKGANLILRPHQQKWVQTKFESLALTLDYTKPVEWLRQGIVGAGTQIALICISGGSYICLLIFIIYTDSQMLWPGKVFLALFVIYITYEVSHQISLVRVYPSDGAPVQTGEDQEDVDTVSEIRSLMSKNPVSKQEYEELLSAITKVNMLLGAKTLWKFFDVAFWLFFAGGMLAGRPRDYDYSPSATESFKNKQSRLVATLVTRRLRQWLLSSRTLTEYFRRPLLVLSGAATVIGGIYASYFFIGWYWQKSEGLKQTLTFKKGAVIVLIFYLTCALFWYLLIPMARRRPLLFTIVMGAMSLGIYLYFETLAASIPSQVKMFLMDYGRHSLFLFLAIPLIVAFLFINSFLPVALIESPILVILSVLILSATLLFLIAEVILKFIRGIVWRIVEYNHGAYPAIILLITIALGLIELYFKSK